ncbi:GlsB/YeaQ/YmgE family stress response membrane protein [Qipengyuania sp. XHP0207]|uniref:GlsB/YeaQ/YmgE family stress response membrane protein n=1 Tax=Qipengyuania sp. XHP0207 TaxID=3038078 RepID=UPI00241D753D|nr:GlsB/YeaQ/YmgE family stress response membrane protein [Qipengyuania sp. XHP0207]MDG5747900.1 GlsB/YeaQ/YmgE family stress response membrane protein [Qipengyuania sp. XHP0207]
MGLLILIVVGAILGWLATIVLRIEDGRNIAIYAGVGVVGSLLAGIVAGNGVIFGAISGTALLWAVLGASIAIGAFSLLRQRAYR